MPIPVRADRDAGGAFALLMMLTSFGLTRYFSEVQDSEMHLTARRSVKAGLIASSVVSSWTLSATLLTSSLFTYLYGIAASFWYVFYSCTIHAKIIRYGAGCSVPILSFAVLAIELKRKAPNADTSCSPFTHWSTKYSLESVSSLEAVQSST